MEKDETNLAAGNQWHNLFYKIWDVTEGNKMRVYTAVTIMLIPGILYADIKTNHPQSHLHSEFSYQNDLNNDIVINVTATTMSGSFGEFGQINKSNGNDGLLNDIYLDTAIKQIGKSDLYNRPKVNNENPIRYSRNTNSHASICNFATQIGKGNNYLLQTINNFKRPIARNALPYNKSNYRRS
jgi:hypothetical protein